MKHYEDLYEFDLETAITEYFEELGIKTKVDVDFDYADPDFETVDLSIYWDEDGDRQSFHKRNAQRFTNEKLFELWVEEREALHAKYLEWLKTEA